MAGLLYRLTLIIAMFFNLGGTAKAVSPSVPHWVTTSGTQFVNQSGSPVVLHGVDFSYHSSLISMIPQVHANFVRMRVLWSDLEPQPGVFSISQTQAIDKAVSYFQAHKISVEMDLRGRTAPAWYGSTKSFYGTDSARSLAAYSPFISYMVNRYRSYPNVIGYGINNEPASSLLTHAGDQQIVTWEAKIRNLIRLRDPNSIVFFQVHGGNLGVPLTCFKCAGFNVAHTVLDWHSYYNGAYGSGMSPDGETWIPNWTVTHNQNFTDYHGTEANQWLNLNIPYARTHKLGIPLLVGEWGVRDDDIHARTYDLQMIDLFTRYKISWSRWEMNGNTNLGLVTKGQLNSEGKWLETVM